MTEKLQQGRVYRGKRPRNCSGLVNDRQILRLFSTTVQYDSPSVANGRQYPTMTIEKFLEWADRDVTDELPAGEWASYPPAKKGKAA